MVEVGDVEERTIPGSKNRAPPSGAMISLATRFSIPTLMSFQVMGVSQLYPEVGRLVSCQTPVPPLAISSLGTVGLNITLPMSM